MIGFWAGDLGFWAGGVAFPVRRGVFQVPVFEEFVKNMGKRSFFGERGSGRRVEIAHLNSELSALELS
jgi:hypothetical protein